MKVSGLIVAYYFSIKLETMKLLKKNKKKGLPIAKPLKAIDLVGKLIEKRLLKTTTGGVFYTFPEIVSIGPTPENVVKNLYLYARSTKLIKPGQVLYIRNLDPDDDRLLGQYDLTNGWVKS